VLAAHPGRVQEVVDLRPMKSNGGLAREAPEAVAAMARLRQLLAGQVS
jgi:NitT/TauT family transport system ATP-binding protein